MKKLVLICACAVLMGAVFAQTNVKTRIHDDGTNELKLRPQTQYDGIIDGLRVIKAEKNFPFIYESLYHISKEELTKSGSGASAAIDINEVSRVLRSVSNMQGMNYYSSTKNILQKQTMSRKTPANLRVFLLKQYLLFLTFFQQLNRRAILC